MSDNAKPSTSAVRDVDARVATASASAKANVALADYKMENDADDARAFESDDESDDASTISGASSLANDIMRASTARSWHAAALVGASMARVDLGKERECECVCFDVMFDEESRDARPFD